MKIWKISALTTMLFMGATSAVMFSSCQNDSCLDLNCKNGGTCADNFCRCPSGFDGPQCENKSADKFLGIYKGLSQCSDNITKIDSVWINFVDEPNYVSLVRSQDPNQVFYGNVVKNELIIKDVEQNGWVSKITVVKEEQKLNLHIENFMPSSNTKDACHFFGEKIK